MQNPASLANQQGSPDLSRKFCIAPMMDWTDRHQRYFARLLSEHALVYTEMVTTGAIIHGGQERHLNFNQEEHPIALQLGGSNPDDLAQCSKIAVEWGYDEVNLNVGCPSDRVQNNMIGACLMGHKELVANCLSAMRDAVEIPITVKHRIGIDELDSQQFLIDFVGHLYETGTRTFIVHARKAILEGLSPKENREIPPLLYDRVYYIKKLYEDAEIIINGGIKTIEDCKHHLQHVDGVMLGREAYQNPWLLASVDEALFAKEPHTNTRVSVVESMIPYVEQQLSKGAKLNHISRHILGIFHGQKGGKQFRRYLSENAHKPGANSDTLMEALKFVR